jgi:hypothetical protein
MYQDSKFKVLLILFVVLLLSTLVIGGVLFTRKGATGLKPISLGQTISPNILYLTQPVYNFSGVVEKTGSDSILVSQNVTLSQMMPPGIPLSGANATIPPTQTPKKLSYTVKITDKTTVTRFSMNVPLLLITPKPPEIPKLSVKDIIVGETVSIQTNTDLRTLSGNTFEAVSINLPQIQNSIMGTITSVESGKITVKPAMPGAQEKEITVTVSADTEISRYLPMDKDNPMPKPEKLSFSDLTPDMQVTVYTDVDVTKQSSVTALRIEPSSISAPMAPPIISPALETPTSKKTPIPTAATSP